MGKTKKITGKAVFINLSGGFWGITSDNGDNYLPVNMPEQYKAEGSKVRCEVTLLEDAASIAMWGQVVRIVSFETF